MSKNSHEAPETFEDIDICNILKDNLNLVDKLGSYDLSCGLLIKLKAVLHRVYKRSHFKLPVDNVCLEEQLYNLVELYTRHTEELHEHWEPKTIWDTALELTCKAVNLSPQLQKDLNAHILYPLDETKMLCFDRDFLQQVKLYHLSVQRPEGTFDLEISDEMREMSLLPREICRSCNGRVQIYCGDCFGLRTMNAEPLFPPRIELPFNILLLLHWQETLHKCTGIQSGALCMEGQVEVVPWRKEKTESDWYEVIGKLQADRDVLLFPSSDAVNASDFQWLCNTDDEVDNVEKMNTVAHSVVHSSVVNSHDNVESSTNSNTKQCNSNHNDECDVNDNNNNSNSTDSHISDSNNTATNCVQSTETTETAPSISNKWRLIILEASWNYGKTMYQQIVEYRQKMGLQPLPCVILSNVTGEYWRFHVEGNSAVSTIEAIAHTARAAGLSDSDYNTLMMLFKIQKYRVLKRMNEGGRPPAAINVQGTGIAGWKDWTDALDDILVVENSGGTTAVKT